ncbi:threonine aldolase family protein [Sneathiella sp. HT1-7]|uniref:threonine aldolase family protein n=1 Tax=Sneathiella sp. HT1-7 TaxID=2887192 RepID=UPI001D133FE4|nr:low specificity L-threonine aldolase [Sneathiella sp. HT1-7]MCC3305457.1 low specificity L-threonine aldolase [Sneathiella sp. HT1-7]
MVKNGTLVNFASDNSAPVAPTILAAIQKANAGPMPSYGNDPLTRGVEEKLKQIFECDLRAFPVATGTAANVLGLSVMTPPYGAIYCHKLAHIEHDECGAPEFYTHGAKLVKLDGADGKLLPAELEGLLKNSGAGNVHHVQPSVIDITQATESGTAYQPQEIAEIGLVAKKYDLGLHMDGARFANALCHLGCAPADITWRAGVDVLSFGATKNGAMGAEAVIFFNLEKAREFEFRRKRGAHLFSKMRYLSAQLDAYLTDDLWLDLAGHANRMARATAEGISAIPGAEILYPVEANMIFARLPEVSLECLAVSDILYYRNGDESAGEVRLVTSWNTSEQDVNHLLKVIA